MDTLTYFLLATTVVFSSCNRNSGNRSAEVYDKEKLIQMNRQMVEDESHLIESYLSRLNVNYETTGTGLRYIEKRSGSGNKPKPGDVVKIAYKVKRLNGNELYSSENTGPKSFVVAQDDVESGIHEGVQLMNTQAQYVFVVPSHLAFGLSGDNDKIPPATPLVYEIELLEILK